MTYRSLTNAHPNFGVDRAKITEFSNKLFVLLDSGLIEPFTRKELHQFCEKAYPGQPWTQEKIVLHVESNRENHSTYGQNAADFGFQKFKRENECSKVELVNGRYTKV